jgi:hypothetical protein
VEEGEVVWMKWSGYRVWDATGGGKEKRHPNITSGSQTGPSL